MTKYRFIIVALFAFSFAQAQTKKPAPKAAAKTGTAQVKKDSTATAKEEPEIRNEFAVYSKMPKDKKERIKLCINLVEGETILNYCVNDSICRSPEVSKILWQKTQGDTTYVLVYIDAFSKPVDKPACDAGHETKLYFARWNTKTNKAVWKSRLVSSCMRGIENMSKEAVNEWDGTSQLGINYYKGNSKFVTLLFSPENYKLGLQIIGDEGKINE
ncbi:MAG: hypothetical protein KF900_01010 [Bacteroidetes bacterium]|nr:hypothetical protein [Bacteroidota bacterium]